MTLSQHVLAPLLALSLLGSPGLQGPPTPGPGAGEADPGAARPDVLLIFLDDANEWVGYLGAYEGAATPRIDALAERGIGFTNAHCTAPLCLPSRTQLLFSGAPTGGDDSAGSGQADPELPALTEAFAAAGYRVVGGGKIFHGDNEAHFPEYLDLPEAPEPSGRRARNLLQYEQDLGTFDWAPLEVEDQAMPDHQLVSWAAERLAEPSDQPLFLAVGLTKPHLPWYLPARYFEQHPLDGVALPEIPDDDLEDLPEQAQRLVRESSLDITLRAKKDRREAVQGYLAALSFVDAQVGRLLDALAASPRADRTLVLLLSDHGLHLGEKRHWRKQSLWEVSTRVPLVLAGPGVPSGERCARPVELSSVYPTLLELCGIPLPEHAHGHSLVPLIENPAADWPHVALTRSRGSVALRDDRYRYIRWSRGGEELYDHAVDPHEWRNLAGDPEFSGALRAARERLDRELAAR